jgi:hypothetical protein
MRLMGKYSSTRSEFEERLISKSITKRAPRIIFQICRLFFPSTHPDIVHNRPQTISQAHLHLPPSLPHSLPHPLTPSLTHSLTHSLTVSLPPFLSFSLSLPLPVRPRGPRARVRPPPPRMQRCVRPVRWCLPRLKISALCCSAPFRHAVGCDESD